MSDEPEVQVTETTTPAGEGETQPVAAPEVTPAGEAPESTALSDEEQMSALETELAQAESKEAKAAVQSKINKRFNEVTRKRHEAELELAKWKGRAEALAEVRTQPTQPAEEVKPPELVLPPKPKKSDFRDEEGDLDQDAFDAALATWGGDVALAKFQHEQQAKEVKTRQEKMESERESWLNQGREKFGDFDEVVRGIGQKAASILGPAISESPMGHELAYYLGNNPKEASRLATLSPISAAREIGKLEIQLAKPPAKKTTTASAPIAPVQPGGVPVSVKTLEEMSTAEFIAHRNKEEFGPRGG